MRQRLSAARVSVGAAVVLGVVLSAQAMGALAAEGVDSDKGPPPSAVIAAAQETLGNAGDRAAPFDDPELGLVWQVSARDEAGRSLLLTVGSDGTVYSLRREVDRESVPAIVLTKVDVALEGFAATAYHALEADGTITAYVLEGTADGQLYEVTVDPGGDDLTIAGAT